MRLFFATSTENQNEHFRSYKWPKHAKDSGFFLVFQHKERIVIFALVGSKSQDEERLLGSLRLGSYLSRVDNTALRAQWEILTSFERGKR